MALSLMKPHSGEPGFWRCPASVTVVAGLYWRFLRSRHRRPAGWCTGIRGSPVPVVGSGRV